MLKTLIVLLAISFQTLKAQTFDFSDFTPHHSAAPVSGDRVMFVTPPSTINNPQPLPTLTKIYPKPPKQPQNPDNN
jgi:hypothetical protein